jgi:hypothetical protein
MRNFIIILLFLATTCAQAQQSPHSLGLGNRVSFHHDWYGVPSAFTPYLHYTYVQPQKHWGIRAEFEANYGEFSHSNSFMKVAKKSSTVTFQRKTFSLNIAATYQFSYKKHHLLPMLGLFYQYRVDDRAMVSAYEEGFFLSQCVIFNRYAQDVGIYMPLVYQYDISKHWTIGANVVGKYNVWSEFIKSGVYYDIGKSKAPNSVSVGMELLYHF